MLVRSQRSILAPKRRHPLRKWILTGVGAAALLFVASPSEAKAQVALSFGTPSYGYYPYSYGYPSYYGGNGLSIGNGHFSLSFGYPSYYSGSYAPNYGSWYGNNGWNGNCGRYDGWYGGKYYHHGHHHHGHGHHHHHR